MRAHRFKTQAVEGSRPILFEGAVVLRRSVALVRGQAIFGEDLVPRAHAGIALHFGQNRCRRDGVAPGVAFDQAALRQGKLQRNRVHQQEIRRGIEAVDRDPHGHSRCLVDVDPVDGGGIHRADGPRHGALANAFGEHFTALRLEQFAVVETSHGSIFGEDYGAGEDCAE